MGRRNSSEHPTFPEMFGEFLPETKKLITKGEKLTPLSHSKHKETPSEDETDENCQYCSGGGPCTFCKRGKAFIAKNGL